MKVIGCRLKLAEDVDWKSSDRVVEVSISGEKDFRQGTWQMVSDARDPRMKIGETGGRWLNTWMDASQWTMFFLPRGDTMILFELFNVGSQPVEHIGCGTSRGGDGWRQGPPESNINYVLSFDCA
jgi:hypothetical protein